MGSFSEVSLCSGPKEKFDVKTPVDFTSSAKIVRKDRNFRFDKCRRPGNGCVSKNCCTFLSETNGFLTGFSGNRLFSFSPSHIVVVRFSLSVTYIRVHACNNIVAGCVLVRGLAYEGVRR